MKQINNNIDEVTSRCKDKFNQILHQVLDSNAVDAHKMENLIYKLVMEIALILLELYFTKFNNGNYGEKIETAKGIAIRGKLSDKMYFSIFGKINVARFLYKIIESGEVISFAPLDIVLNLPKRCYSYLLSEFANLLNINGSYLNTINLLKKFFYIKISVSASETITYESSEHYEEFYELKKDLISPLSNKDNKVVSFDGKGIPMIKKEAAKITGRLGKGEKKMKKKEALVGAKYNIDSNIRTPEEVASNLVFPDEKKKKDKDHNKAQDIRYIASVEKSKKAVMKEIYDEVKDEDFKDNPLICVMDGALILWVYLKEIFKNIENKVLILDIIHVIEYIWLIANLKENKENKKSKDSKDSKDKDDKFNAKQYVFEKLLQILKGNVSLFMKELKKEMLDGELKNKQTDVYKKVITYLENHKEYMKYDQYLAKGYPIASGVVESACSHVVADRMELSGARWGIIGSESVLKLRSVSKSMDWDKYWECHTELSNDNLLLPDDYILKLAA